MVDLQWREFEDRYSHVTTTQLWASAHQFVADVTIAIPTYNRSSLLPDALISALGQKTKRKVKIIIIDNCSDAYHTEQNIKFLCDSAPDNVIYLKNSENIGMFGNWNRCLTVAESKWINILNDDDVLLDDFIDLSLNAAEENNAEAVVARTRSSDMQGENFGNLPLKTKILALVRGNRVVTRLVGSVTRITIRDLFWGVPLGNSLCFLGNRREMLRAGGFREQDYPAGDYLFYARWATERPIFRIERVLGLVRYGENESMKRSTMEGFIRQSHGLRKTLVEGGYAPKSWLSHADGLLSKDMKAFKWLFNCDFSQEEVQNIIKEPNFKKGTGLIDVVRLYFLGLRKAL